MERRVSTTLSSIHWDFECKWNELSSGHWDYIWCYTQPPASCLTRHIQHASPLTLLADLVPSWALGPRKVPEIWLQKRLDLSIVFFGKGLLLLQMENNDFSIGPCFPVPWFFEFDILIELKGPECGVLAMVVFLLNEIKQDTQLLWWVFPQKIGFWCLTVVKIRLMSLVILLYN